LQITNAYIMGHSMGGMLATRFALMYPRETKSLILVSPIGLEDWKTKGVPYLTIDQWYQEEIAQTPALVRAYQKENYYHGTWQPAFEPWVEMQSTLMSSTLYPRLAWSHAVIDEMIYSQPVCYEFNRLNMPVLLLVGLRDRTAIGRKYVTKEVGAVLGNYATLGSLTAQAIPRCQLVEFDDLGHLPHIEAFQRFITPVKTFLNADKLRTQVKK
jgi:pimeloyl-ACP methyl ester carboxylesterase